MSVKFKQGVASKGSKNIESLKDALAADAKCGCGIECDCYGMLVLPNWNSTTGEREDGWAIYIVDGAIQVADKATAEAEIDGYKALQ